MSTELEKAYAYCESVTKFHARSFYFAAKFLPKKKQRAVYPIYAFCRHVDDEIDEIGDGDEAKAIKAVENWRNDLNEIYTPTSVKNPKSEIRNPKSADQALVFLAWRDLLKTYKIHSRVTRL